MAGRASTLHKTEWWGAGVVICLERGAVLHMAQLMPLPLTVSCFSEIQTGFTFLVPAHLGSPGQRAVKRVCVYVQPPTSAVNVTLSAFAAESWRLLSTDISCQWALSTKPTASVYRRQTMKQVDRQTDAQPFHRPCYAYCVGSVDDKKAAAV